MAPNSEGRARSGSDRRVEQPPPQRNRTETASRRDLPPWFDGIVERTGLTKGDPGCCSAG
jgi:hypothetical protein